MSPTPAPAPARRAKRALAHQCPACRRPWALRVVRASMGRVIVCRYCATIRTCVPGTK